ncbi:glycosyltransferase [Variovorax sp. J22R133]|uniref:glycosyltransferase n=1 Tax=Variovorax brevis TaxID=3053503 RepID=UPI0025782C1C|nr:glycosyltransferase [Variovorax sp. J22R133]MDM0114686.1 glycosyltransferase [Variovorax sp. J22R133]
MRVVIDLQGTQSADLRSQGIAQHTAALTLAMARAPRGHDLMLALNGRFNGTIEAVKRRFGGLIAPGNLRIWHPAALPGLSASERVASANAKLYEAFLASLRPDVVHVMSFFEGWRDPAVISVGAFARLPTAVSVHDADLSAYVTDPTFRHWAEGKIHALRQSDRWFAASDAARKGGIAHFGLDAARCIVISPDADNHSNRRREGVDWDETARRIWEGLEDLRSAGARLRQSRPDTFRPLLAYISAPSPEHNAIAPRDAELVPHLAPHYDIELISDQPVDDPRLAAFPTRSVEWFRRNLSAFSRVLYNIGTGERPLALDLLTDIAGIVVLQDFNLSPALARQEAQAGHEFPWARALYASHGYGAVQERFDGHDATRVALKFPATFIAIANAQGVIVSSDDAVASARQWFPASDTGGWAVIPHQATCTIDATHPSGDEADRALTRRALAYVAAIERFAAAALSGRDGLIKSIGLDMQGALNPERSKDLAAISQAIVDSLPSPLAQLQLFLDVSELVTRDAGTGIQRVVRNLLRELLTRPPAGYRIEPVLAVRGRVGYRYARRFTLEFLSCPGDVLEDEPVDMRAGDVFVGLDLVPRIAIEQRDFYQRMRQAGVRVEFVVYDLLPIQLRNRFMRDAAELHEKWLGVVAESDGAICISRSVAEELRSWVQAEHRGARAPDLRIQWFHLGTEPLKGSSPALPSAAEASTLQALGDRPTFLMVGTIEPRKGHALVLDAFDRMWASGLNANLVVVGKKGWMVEALAARLRKTASVRSHLFWIENASDSFLKLLYAASSCLIAASEGEGFGLPLIEAAQHGLPLLARDIPVFREVARDHASYFGDEPASLESAVMAFLNGKRRGKPAPTGALPYLTWAESADSFARACGLPHLQGN